MKNDLREKLAEKSYLLGAFSASCDGNLVEILGLNGIDFVILDMEHSPIGLENMVHLIRAAELYGVVPIARVYAAEAKLMRRVLDIGAHGLMIPMVNTVEDAAYIINAVKYPPLGQRGMNAGRGPRWGAYENYAQEANDALVTLFQCETAEGVQNVEAIAKTPGLDGIFIGSADLSMSLGHPKDVGHFTVQAAIDHVLAVCKAQHILSGIVTTTAEEATMRIEQGFQIVTIMNDLGFFRRQSNAYLRTIHSACSQRKLADRPFDATTI